MSNADKCGQGEGGQKKGHFVQTSFMDDPKSDNTAIFFLDSKDFI